MLLTHTYGGPLGSPGDWLNEFSSRISAHNEFIAILRPLAFEQSLTQFGRAEDADKSELRHAELYFYWFTLPVLTAFGLLDRRPEANVVYIAAAQLCFGLHLQQLDDVIDETLSLGERATQLKRAHVYYARARKNLTAAGFNWSDAQEDTYVQFLEYESEIAAGDLNDCYLLWRRASPLCILTETYLGNSSSGLALKKTYRNFISWSLLHSDCNDALKDLRLGHITPVTAIFSRS